MRIFDTHAHLYFPAFAPNLADEVAACEQAGVTHQVQIGCDEISCLAALELANQYDNFYCTLGLHPCDVDQLGIKHPEYHRYAGLDDYQPQCQTSEAFFAWVEALFLKNQEKVVGFGETGFDLHHRHTPELLKKQTEDFRAHIQLCEKYDRALVIHTRHAPAETLKFLADEKPAIRGIIHAFSEGPDFAREVTEQYGFYLGIGGVATYPKMEMVREAIKTTPIEFLLTETDAPFLTPQRARKTGVKTNSPKYLPEVVELIAQIKDLDPAECAQQLFENAQRCFGLTR